MSEVHDDISYMRRLAEQGRRGQILGGTFLAAAGIVFGATCFIQWAAVIGLLPMTDRGALWLWLGAFALFTVIWFALFFRIRRRPGVAASSSNAVFGIAWTGSAIGIIAALASVHVVSLVLKVPVVLTAYVPMIFVFYGVAWFTSAALTRRIWMYWPAVASFAFGPVMAALTTSRFQVAAMGMALLLLLTLPGLKLVVDEPRP